MLCGERSIFTDSPPRLHRFTQQTVLTSPKLVTAMNGQATGTNKKTPMRKPSFTPLSALTTDRTANQCYQLAAELSADLADFPKAIQLYETVADWSLTSALTKYSVKEYWLRAALCSMAMGVSPFLFLFGFMFCISLTAS